METKCPKCGYIRKAEDQSPYYECPKCGIVYFKYLATLHSDETKALTEEPDKEPKKPTTLFERMKHRAASTLRATYARLPFFKQRPRYGVIAAATIIICAVGATLFITTSKERPPNQWVLCVPANAGSCGIFDLDKRTFVIPPQFEDIRFIRDTAKLLIKLNNLWGIIDEEGRIVVQPQFEDVARHFQNNALIPVQKNGLWGFIEINGRVVIPHQYQETLLGFNKNGLAIVKENGAWIYINTEGHRVFADFEMIHSFYAVSGPTTIEKQSLAAVKKNGLWGFIDANERMVIPPQFDRVGTGFSGPKNLFAVKQYNLWGYIDASGQFAIPLQFDDARSFSDNGLAAVKKNNRWGFIDVKGNTKVPYKFDDMRLWADLSNNLIPVKINDKWGYASQKGEIAIPSIYDDAEEFSDHFLANVKQNGRWGYIDAKGIMKINAQFDEAGRFSLSGVARVRKNGKTHFINTRGDTLVFEDQVCDTSVLKDEENGIIWPDKSMTQICAEAHFLKDSKAAMCSNAGSISSNIMAMRLTGAPLELVLENIQSPSNPTSLNSFLFNVASMAYAEPLPSPLTEAYRHMSILSFSSEIIKLCNEGFPRNLELSNK